MSDGKWWNRWLGKKDAEPQSLKADVHAALRAHTGEFKREVVCVTQGVYVAIGYGLANSIMLEGEDGVVIVDTMESAEAAEEVKDAFELLCDKPIKAIIYTHNHTDHIFGAGVFADGEEIDVYAHELTATLIDRLITITRPAISVRSMRQFGVFLSKEDFENAGIGPMLRVGKDATLSPVRPNKTFSERLEFEIAGLSLVLLHTPGETDDQISIWMPKKKLMICADNFYKSFPNLYAIRGTASRDVMQWVESLDVVRGYRPDILVPCHTRPLIGHQKIHQVLTDYRDAIQFVHDQTIRGMNRGWEPEEIAAQLELPPHLAQSPFLKEFYGTVGWSSRAIFAGYLGWFGGNPTRLDPLSSKERARRMADLVGGVDALKKKVSAALKEQDMQWVLELTEHLLSLLPEDKQVIRWRVEALKVLGSRHSSANGRNYYLTCALELQGLKIPTMRKPTPELVHPVPLMSFFRAMSVGLAAEKCLDLDHCIGFRFPDTQEAFTLHIRRGVAEIQPHFPDNPEISLTIDSLIWKEILAGLRNPVTTFASGKIKVEGSVSKLVGILRLFEKR